MVFTAGLVSCAVWQTAVLRACAASSTAVVKRLYAWSSLGFLIRFLVPQFLGLCALAFFRTHATAHDAFFGPDGRPVGDPTVTMQAMPLFLGQILPTGVLGLIAAGMPIDTLGLVLMLSMQGAGDTRAVLVVSVVMQWLILLPTI